MHSGRGRSSSRMAQANSVANGSCPSCPLFRLPHPPTPSSRRICAVGAGAAALACRQTASSKANGVVKGGCPSCPLFCLTSFLPSHLRSGRGRSSLRGAGQRRRRSQRRLGGRAQACRPPPAAQPQHAAAAQPGRHAHLALHAVAVWVGARSACPARPPPRLSLFGWVLALHAMLISPSMLSPFGWVPALHAQLALLHACRCLGGCLLCMPSSPSSTLFAVWVGARSARAAGLGRGDSGVIEGG